jgi:lysine 2,3-aminomutase
MKTDDWDNWRWQLSNSVRNLEDLKKELNLLENEKVDNINNLPLRITPYFLDLVKNDVTEILRKTVIPSINETIISPDESSDPLEEDGHLVENSCLIHKYPDRVLFTVTNFCSTYCRYCTRSRVVGGESNFRKELIDNGIEYIRNHPEIRDVLISGGDPLTMGTKSLEYIISKIRSIKHVEVIRIGTKVPVVMPQRITDGLCNMLKKYHPLYISIHFIHPLEITPECQEACNKLANVGIVMKSQTVLLKGINDDVETMKKLMHELLKIRVSPYYIYSCDKINGSSHFRSTIDKGLEIIDGLRGYTSGYAVPTFIVDSKYGKIPVYPENIIERNEDSIKLKSFTGKILEYTI